MGFFSNFLGGLFTSGNTLSQQEMRRRLAGKSSLERNDKETLKKLLRSRAAGGYSSQDIDKAVREMKNNPNDGVTRAEAERIRRELKEGS